MSDICYTLIEPECSGYQHSEFNAALIVAITIAFPTRKKKFVAESNHIEIVKKAIKRQGIENALNEVVFETAVLGVQNKSSQESFFKKVVKSNKNEKII